MKVHRWLLLVMACYLAVTVPLVFLLPVWVDEVYSLRTSSRGLWEALKAGIFFELQAPAYFGLLSLWRTMDSSPEFARMLSVLAGLASLAVCARISRLVFPKIPEACLPAMAAFHPLFLYASLEIRVYATAMLTSAVLIELYVRAFLGSDERRRDLVAFSLVATISLYTQYYLGFLLASLFVVLVLARRGRAMVRYLMAMGLAGLLCTPLLYFLPAQLAQNGNVVVAEVLPLAPRESLKFLATYHDLMLLPWMTPLLSQIPSPGIVRLLYWLFRLVPWGLAIILLLRRPPVQAGGRTATLHWLLLFTCCLLAFAVVGMLGYQHLVLETRYWTILVVPAMVALLSPFALSGRRATIAVSLLLVCCHCVMAWGQYRTPLKFGDGKRVARYLMENESPGQPIAVYTNCQALVLDVEYRGVNTLIPLPFPQPVDRFDHRNLIVPSEASVEQAVERHASRAEFLWLVMENPQEAKAILTNRKYVTQFFERHYDLVRHKEFHDRVTVDLYRRRDTSRTEKTSPDGGQHRDADTL